MTDFFSVVIPLYNKEKHIHRAINSVLAQTYQNFELIIVDDGSTDCSYEAANAINDPRIKIIRQKNLGVSAARNFGAREAKSEWLAFLDADDEWEPQLLEKFVDLICLWPNCGLYGSAYTIVNPRGKKEFPQSPYPSGSIIVINDIFNDFRLFYPFNSSSVVVGKRKLIEVGGFPINVHEGEDVITWMNLFLTSQVAFINLPLSIYHHDAANRACDRYSNRLGTYPPVDYLLKKLDQSEIPKEYNNSVIEYIAKYQITAAKRNLRSREPHNALRFLWSCKETHEQKRLWKKIFIKAVICLFIPSYAKKI